jgi:UDPglucose 6-dehydrogenase
MRVSMVGLGKLGLPASYAMASRGLEVFGYDPAVWHPPRPADCDHEQGLAEAIRASDGRVRFCDLTDAVNNTDGVVFVAVQTPHEPRFEGVTPLPEDRADFDYTFLIDAVTRVVSMADALEKDITLAVISTVLPGTLEREIVPLLSDRVSLVYNPSFIAMGTTIRDFLDPEFVLLGGDNEGRVRAVYEALDIAVSFGEGELVAPSDPQDEVFARVYVTSIRDAELIKVAYNTFIGLKIAFANTLMEICHKTGGDVDEVTGALKLAHRRLISGAYMDGGMGDGGGCHPRDNIALSWLASELGLSYDLFGSVMECREEQARWLAALVADECRTNDLLPGLLGVAYKPGSHIVTGSAALLVRQFIREEGFDPAIYDPHTGDKVKSTLPVMDQRLDERKVWLVGCRHPEFVDLKLPEGSIVIDPFRYIPDQEGVTVVRVGQAPDLGAAPHNGQAATGREVRPTAA